MSLGKKCDGIVDWCLSIQVYMIHSTHTICSSRKFHTCPARPDHCRREHRLLWVLCGRRRASPNLHLVQGGKPCRSGQNEGLRVKRDPHSPDEGCGAGGRRILQLPCGEQCRGPDQPFSHSHRETSTGIWRWLFHVPQDSLLVHPKNYWGTIAMQCNVIGEHTASAKFKQLCDTDSTVYLYNWLLEGLTLYHPYCRASGCYGISHRLLYRVYRAVHWPQEARVHNGL